MAAFLWTKERTGELWGGRDRHEVGTHSPSVPPRPAPKCSPLTLG